MNANGWRPDVERNQGNFDEPWFWMTRDLADGWRVRARLYTDNYRTVIDRLDLEAGDETLLRGIRGHLETPTGEPRRPTWQRYSIGALRREASAALETLLLEHHQTSTERLAAQQRGDWPPADPRETVDHALAAFATLRGFTVPALHATPRNTRKPSPINSAILAAAYADAVQNDGRSARDGTKQRLDKINRHYAPSTIGPLIAQARKDGLLTSTRRGKAGGQLTAKAHRILREAQFHSAWYPSAGT
jgi:hypothetical protein